MPHTLESLRADYDALKARGLSLDLTRGKPSAAQLDLSNGLLGIDLSDDYRDAAGTDLRNYGGADGVLELRQIFAEVLGIPVAQLLAGNNASLQFMHDTLVHALLHGVPGGEPWVGQDVAFLCPSPGYDRHFALTESFGIRMISVPYLADGSLDLPAIAEHLADPAVRGMWLVPTYANPTGSVVDEATARALVALPAAAGDFRIFWDNAYAVHHLTEAEPAPLDILGFAAEAGNPDRVFVYASTSKITQAGAGVSFFASSPANVAWFREHASVQTIGPDKLNQLRHARFFRDAEGVRALMRRHRELLAPKFALVDRVLGEKLSGRATWTKPAGGYFVTLYAPDGTAARAVQLAKGAGIAITPAGAAYPYGDDPRDSVIRIAPSLPPESELEPAIEALALCVLLAEAELGAPTR
ncbi:aminotransferase class I/II-fold pyridoxal phosphate-dependent enzyme [Protaetiibacter intestinalis]|uniref:Aminotransferase class I/II-fold pyridoxal phosphate-dependent enzyme n=1 Tax=Protaetiibacter intestinalis TaxID=2419774 RepID=A0A387B9J5_9MICO|nr:aminotransferase class I/II-fold pyridoxal phosphate-dependent enzyme [Protaetiibacter intestinalis]AYF99023.1 aminotransferase class I/II-fold pyridoxal phosphate-dependent enzyme [Protaetiibacter intestinalis]